jgi:hypothetical protein
MCEQCGDSGKSHEEHVIHEPERRKMLKMAGASVLAAPLLGVLSSGHAEAQAAAPELGKSPFVVRAYGAQSVGGNFAPLQIQRRALGTRRRCPACPAMKSSGG